MFSNNWLTFRRANVNFWASNLHLPRNNCSNQNLETFNFTYNCRIRFDFEKFMSACTDVKQNIQSRLNQWTEYEDQHDKLVIWLNECEANLKTYNVKASLEEKIQQLDRFKVTCLLKVFFN